MSLSKITIFLWFDGKAEEAANHYTSIFSDSKINRTTRYLKAGSETHGQTPGSVMSVEFELNGHPFVALNGGPMLKFSGATSFQIHCKDQAEVDHFWSKLTEGGDESKQRCGWLEDKFGVTWQVVPNAMVEMFKSPDTKKAGNASVAMMKMKKLDIDELKEAFNADD